jgi:hypothetical protein
MELFTLGTDLGKTTFHVVGMNQRGEVLLRKRFSRVQLLHFTANLKGNAVQTEVSLMQSDDVDEITPICAIVSVRWGLLRLSRICRGLVDRPS